MIKSVSAVFFQARFVIYTALAATLHLSTKSAVALPPGLRALPMTVTIIFSPKVLNGTLAKNRIKMILICFCKYGLIQFIKNPHENLRQNSTFSDMCFKDNFNSLSVTVHFLMRVSNNWIEAGLGRIILNGISSKNWFLNHNSNFSAYNFIWKEQRISAFGTNSFVNSILHNVYQLI